MTVMDEMKSNGWNDYGSVWVNLKKLLFTYISNSQVQDEIRSHEEVPGFVDYEWWTFRISAVEINIIFFTDCSRLCQLTRFSFFFLYFSSSPCPVLTVSNLKLTDQLVTAESTISHFICLHIESGYTNQPICESCIMLIKN